MTETEEKPFTIAEAIEAVEVEHYDDDNNRFVNAYSKDGKLIVELSPYSNEFLYDAEFTQRFVFTGVEEEASG